MDGYQQISLTSDEMSRIKSLVTFQASFADRISIALAFRLINGSQLSHDSHKVMFEINNLENGILTSTKSATQFKHPPLYPFWHKHFVSSRQLLRNIGERWNLAKGNGNPDLDDMIWRITREQCNNPDNWPRLLTHRFVMGALEERIAANRMTGDWIIYGKYEGENYYLDLATHEEGRPGENARKLAERLRSACECEFPFLFKDVSEG